MWDHMQKNSPIGTYYNAIISYPELCFGDAVICCLHQTAVFVTLLTGLEEMWKASDCSFCQ